MKKQMQVALAGSMTLALASIVSLAPVASSHVKTALAGPVASDFALLDQELTVGDKSVQCGEHYHPIAEPLCDAHHDD